MSYLEKGIEPSPRWMPSKEAVVNALTGMKVRVTRVRGEVLGAVPLPSMSPTKLITEAERLCVPHTLVRYKGYGWYGDSYGFEGFPQRDLPQLKTLLTIADVLTHRKPDQSAYDALVAMPGNEGELPKIGNLDMLCWYMGDEKVSAASRNVIRQTFQHIAQHLDTIVSDEQLRHTEVGRKLHESRVLPTAILPIMASNKSREVFRDAIEDMLSVRYKSGWALDELSKENTDTGIEVGAKKAFELSTILETAVADVRMYAGLPEEQEGLLPASTVVDAAE